MRFKGTNLSSFVKTASGILIFSLVIAGVAVYFSEQDKSIIYQFNPEHAYVYTFQDDFFRLDYREDPRKSVSLLSDGLRPLCLFGCFRKMDREQLAKSLIQSPVRNKNQEARPSFAYLVSGSKLGIEFDMGKGSTVKERFPYANRIIVEFKNDTRMDDLSVKGYGYEFRARDEQPSQVKPVEREFVFSQKFGQSSVLTLDKPYFISRIVFDLKENRVNFFGLRGASLYLERKKHRHTVSKVEDVLLTGTDVNLKELKEEFTRAYSLDPYSPMTDYLIAKINFRRGNYRSAMSLVNRGIRKMDKYSSFLADTARVEELFKLKARIAGAQKRWDVAITNMKQAVPNVDHLFLSEIYLDKYLESEKTTDLKSSFFHSCLSYQETPRLILTALKKYRQNDRWLVLGLDYYEKEVKKLKKGYRLEGGQVFSSYLVNLSISLLTFWKNEPGSFNQLLGELTAAENNTDNPEKLALIRAVKARVYRRYGEVAKANRALEQATEFFYKYSSLYESWIEFARHQ